MPRKTPSPNFDTAAALPELVELRRFAATGDYARISELLLDLHERDERLLCSAANAVAETAGIEQVLSERVSKHPDDVMALTLLAFRHVRIGWEIRGSAMADQVSGEQFDAFFEHLRYAERILIDVCAIEPEWSLPWYVRLLTARGLELGLSETRRRYDRLAEHQPDHYEAQSQLLVRLYPKWGGTWDEAFEFARGCAASAPAGSPAATLVADAHLEFWLNLENRDRAAYFQQDHVRREIQDASRSSALHPEFRRGFHWVYVHSVFACLLARAGDPDAARPHFQALGDLVDHTVWTQVGETSDVVKRCRLQELATGARP